MKKTEVFVRSNAVAITLVLIFAAVYFSSQRIEEPFLYFGTTGMKYLGGEYYRWFTCLFLHSNIRHLLANSIGLLSVSSLLGSFLGKWKTVFLFLTGGILAEIAYSVVVTDLTYDIGASSGIFALIACLLICYLRFQDQFHFAWYRPDAVITVIYFVFANSSTGSFLVHTFGFAAGILISFIMVQAGIITARQAAERDDNEEKEI